MRIGLDSVNHQAILNVVNQGHSLDGWIILGYVNGKVSAWPKIGFDELTQRGIQVARIDVLGNAWNDAAILDVEKGDVQNPATITSWVRNRADHYGDPIVYCNESNLPMVVSAAAAAGVHCGIWLAKPTGIPPLDPATVGVSLPTNLYLAAVQFTQNQGAGGGAVDVSMWFRDDWHPELAAAGHPASMVNQAYSLTDPAASPLGDVSRETSPADPTEAGTGAGGEPDPSASSTPPDGSGASSESASPGPSTPIPSSSSADPATTPGPSPDLSSGSSSATPDPMPPRAEAAGPTPAPASAEASSTAPSPTPSTPTPPAPAGPGGVVGEIDALINRAKNGISDLASLLHSQSFHATAGRLESAIGEAVQLAGLISKIPGL